MPAASLGESQCGEDSAGARDAAARAVEAEIWDLLQTHVPPGVALQRCSRFLRPSKPKPQERMRWKGQRLSVPDTHLAWCAQLRSQSDPPWSFDVALEAEVAMRVRDMERRAEQHLFGGRWDSPILPHECADVVSDWHRSPGIPVDKLPRAAFQAACRPWDAVVCCLQHLVGPGALAVRPRRWRRATLHTEFKGGDPGDVENHRLLYRKVQMGLMQESLLFNRLKSQVWGALKRVHSGYG